MCIQFFVKTHVSCVVIAFQLKFFFKTIPICIFLKFGHSYMSKGRFILGRRGSTDTLGLGKLFLGQCGKKMFWRLNKIYTSECQIRMFWKVNLSYLSFSNNLDNSREGCNINFLKHHWRFDAKVISNQSPYASSCSLNKLHTQALNC